VARVSTRDAIVNMRGATAMDRLVFAYLAITGLFALIFGGRLGLGIAIVHALACVAVLALGRWQPRKGFVGFLRASYGVALCPAFYAELAILNRFFTERFFDGLMQDWDAIVFGGQPSMDLSVWLPWLPFSEVLHLGYFAYYAIVPAALIGAYATRGFDALARVAFGVTAAFFVSYMIFAVFPVAGPRYEFVRIGGEISDGALYGLVHSILEGGSSKGTAFPSSHIAASLVAVLGAGREDARWFWLLIIPELALALGTVYGRFHYGVDALAGVAVALAVWLATPALFRALERGQPGRQPDTQAGRQPGA